MSGGTPLIDKLLSTPALQRSDLVPLKGQLGILQPDVITDVEAVANDTRLPSRAAIERQLGVDPGLGTPASALRQAAGTADGASLSATARLISTILGTAPSATEAVRGAAPLWQAATAPDTAQLAAALARNVAGSGLFYESHLLQFFTGQRTLVQLRKEPQAALRDFSLSDDAAVSATANARTGAGLAAAAAATPADAIPLLRQQLELLALSQFRWSGEAWPGAGMEWEITERGQRRQDRGEGGAEEAQCSWSTSLSMSLPRLGDIVLHLRVLDGNWELELAAAAAPALSSMQAASAQLQQRFAAAGLPLRALKVVQLPQSETKNDS